MENKTNLVSRRTFLKTSATATGGLLIAFYIPTGLKKAFGAEAAAHAAPAAPVVPIKPNAFVLIAPDNSITLTINKLEMGQGVNTSMAQLIAEELDCDWTKIRSVSAPVDAVYNHTQFGMQMTGGSSALNSSWEQHRKIGATLKQMLKTAAAAKWKVPISELKTEDGYVIHPVKGKLSYGELSESAGQLQIPTDAPLKNPSDFKIIGQSVKRVDAPAKSNGQAIFGLDVKIPGMLYAAVSRPPVPGSKLKSFKTANAKNVKGVVDVVPFGDRVAVLATNTYAALHGRDALEADWQLTDFSSSKQMKDFKARAKLEGLIAENKGDAKTKLAHAKHKITAEYEFPFLCHAPMEPMNCTINYDGKTCELWSGHQMPTVDRATAAAVLGLKPEDVQVHTTYAGGSFGRRASKNADYVTEAALLAKTVKKPLKVVWSREDDMHGGYYRPMNFHSVQVGFDEKHQLSGWNHHVVGNSVIGGSAFEAMMVKNGLEATVTEGVSESAYAIPDFLVRQTRVETPVNTLWWRSVGHTHTAFVMETMIDEIAHEMKTDALKLRRDWLKKSPRHLAVLDQLEKMTGWGKKKAPKGRAWGLAIHESFGTVVGQVAEVSVKDHMPVVHKVWASVHCGQVVNPEGARTQVEGAIVYGLSAALYQEVKIEGGKVITNNFDNYPVMRINEMPLVEVDFVKTSDKPTGLGEPGLPPIAPAVANAFFALTKKRVRKLPFQTTV